MFGKQAQMNYFRNLFMKKNKRTYSVTQKLSAVFMILTLMWLTISTPFVFACQQELAKQGKISCNQTADNPNDDESNPLGSNTEEKVPTSNNSLSEEYIHDHYITHYFFSADSEYHKGENASIYIAFHGELLVPPPNAA